MIERNGSFVLTLLTPARRRRGPFAGLFDRLFGAVPAPREALPRLTVSLDGKLPEPPEGCWWAAVEFVELPLEELRPLVPAYLRKEAEEESETTVEEPPGPRRAFEQLWGPVFD